MNSVTFHIHRKSAFVGCLLPYKLCINGEFVGTLKNGKMLDVVVPRAKRYYLNEVWFLIERNGFFDDDGSREYHIVIKRAGGWKTDSYNEFYRLVDDKMLGLPSFKYDKYWSAMLDNEEFAKLTESEKTFTRCLEFENDICDDLDDLLCNEHYHEMLEAVRVIGANGIYDAITSFVAEQFSSDVALPFEDSPDSPFFQAIMEKGYDVLKKCRKNGIYEEFRKCLVCYLTSHIL